MRNFAWYGRLSSKDKQSPELSFPSQHSECASKIEEEQVKATLDERYRGIPAEKRLPSFLLGAAISARPGSQHERDSWLARAADLVEERVDAIVSAKHRGAYERAARLAVSCGEAIALARDRDRGFAFVIEARERFPRHHAFRSELDRATEASPYLPAPPRRKRR